MLNDVLEITKKLRVLYVEDEDEARESMLMVLNNFFSSIDIATNGKEGLEKFIKNSYDLVITDITMPYMNGIDMMNKIKELAPETKVIILSAHNDKENMLKAIEEQADGFLLKPLDMKKLVALLKKLSAHIRLKIENENYKKNLEKMVEEKSQEILKAIFIDKTTGIHNCVKLQKDIGNDEKYLIIIDVVNFRNLNSAFGFDFGDRILYELATYLQHLAPKDTEVYRCKNSDFGYLINSTDKEYIQSILDLLEKHLSKFFVHQNGTEIFFTFKAVAVKGSGGELINKAESAISVLKAKNIKNTYRFFYEDIDALKIQKDKIFWTNKTIKAIKDETIEPFFQAIVDNQTKKVVKYEVLARLIDGNDIVSPYFFIDPAKDAGLLQDITKIIIRKSFKKIANTNKQISVNISESDLDLGYLERFLIEQLEINNLKANQITLEVLEGISASGADENLEQLLRLKKIGFVIAIDDFGTGFSNFERVYKMNPDFIKIDGAFIKDIDVNENSYKIAKSIDIFANSIGAKVVAEFVSREEVYNIVRDMGVEYSQGYYFNEPSREPVEF